MVEKTIMCPACKNQIKVQGNPGEKVYITCPNCQTKGKYTFPGQDFKSKLTDSIPALEIKNVTKVYNGFKAVPVVISSCSDMCNQAISRVLIFLFGMV